MDEEFQPKQIKDIFEHEEMKEIFQTNDDILIRDLDIPERL